MNKKIQMFRKCKNFFYGLMAAILMMAVPLPAFAFEDGAYTVSRTTSYANPETGETADGGTNLALGDSMSESIIEKEVLVEQSGAKTYVTLGIGLMSNISNVKVQIQREDGTYGDAEITQTGSHETNGDTCNHYRFAVDSTDQYISPILFVDPMGRDVQFFVKLDMETASPGTGVFLSEMIPAENQTEASEEENDSIGSFSEEIKTQSGVRYMAIGISAAVFIAAVPGIIFICKRRKK